ncbi:MAG: chemotaxis protein CheD, partial [bacterium]|nr:chemotaxis protein CheD [bacterium]
MNHIVGVADMTVLTGGEGVIVTHALGSCLGLMIFDPVAKVAGLLHAMLPASKLNPEKAAKNPCMFVDTGVPALFEAYYGLGGKKERAILKAVGCGEPLDSEGLFRVGARNYAFLKKLMWKNGILLAEEDVGGTASRTVYLDASTGRVLVRS